MKNNYSFKKADENMAVASGRNLNVSMKQAIEICKYVRGRSLTQAKTLLGQAIELKKPVPFTRFTNGLGHKPGMAAGRYHPKACSEILKVIESAEANAKNKGMNIVDMKLLHIAAQTAAKQRHYGRKRSAVFKAAHIEVVLQEVKGLGKKSEKKSEKKLDDKSETVKKE